MAVFLFSKVCVKLGLCQGDIFDRVVYKFPPSLLGLCYQIVPTSRIPTKKLELMSAHKLVQFRIQQQLNCKIGPFSKNSEFVHLFLIDFFLSEAFVVLISLGYHVWLYEETLLGIMKPHRAAS